MKVCIVCYGLRENNIRLQPWRYISEIAKGLILKGVDVKILTDGTGQEQLLEGISVLYADKLRSLPFIKNNKLISLISKEKPDIILWSMGPIDYFYLSTLRETNIPIIGMFTGPIYKLKDITRLGMREIISNFSSLSVQIIYASLPSLCSRNLVNSQTLSKVFVMSRKNMDMLVSMGADVNKIAHIPAGIDEYDLIQPEYPEYVISKFNVSVGSFNILYFGSPINIRGIDSLIRAVAKVSSVYPNVRLLVLSRRRDNELSQEELHLKSLINETDIEKNVQIVSGFLDKKDVKSFIKFCDVVCLPFKIVPSDIPTSILESMAMGKTVISTNVDGIPELLKNGRGIVIEPNDDEELASKILSCIDDTESLRDAEKKSLDFIMEYPFWADIADSVLQEMNLSLTTTRGETA